MWAFATNPVHGLGLTDAMFWASTPRELAAHRRALDVSREFLLSMNAGIQATLHNAHFRTERGQPPFEAAMFMPNYRPTQKRAQTPWQEGLAKARATAERLKKGPISQTDNHATVVMMSDRIERVKQAQARGEPREVIDRIMQGVA